MLLKETQKQWVHSKSFADTLNFNVRNGKVVSLNDIMLPGYQTALNAEISDKTKQFGIDEL